jgi:predicted Zn-dependent peptidase
MIDILGDGRTSRLYKSIYEEKELTAEPPRVYTGPSERYDNLMVISAEPRYPHTLKEVEEAIYIELGKMKEELVTERELQRVKNKLSAQVVRTMGSNIGIAFQLLTGEIYYGDYTGMFEMIDKTKMVTAEEIRAAAKKYLTEKNRVVACRVQVKEEGEQSSGGDQNRMKKYQKDVIRFIQSLPMQEQREIGNKFQSMKSEQEIMKLGLELFERAKAAGYIKEEGE